MAFVIITDKSVGDRGAMSTLAKVDPKFAKMPQIFRFKLLKWPQSHSDCTISRKFSGDPRSPVRDGDTSFHTTAPMLGLSHFLQCLKKGWLCSPLFCLFKIEKVLSTASAICVHC